MEAPARSPFGNFADIWAKRAAASVCRSSCLGHRQSRTTFPRTPYGSCGISLRLEWRELCERLWRRRRRLATLVGLACIFGSSLNFAESFEQVANAVRPILDFDAMGVGLLGVNGRDLELVGKVADSPEPPSLAGIPLDDLSFSAKVRAGEAVLIRDAHAELDPACPGDRRLIERGNGSCLSVPLWFCDDVGGVLFFAKRRPNWYDGADVEVASGIAGQVVVALQHQRLAGRKHAEINRHACTGAPLAGRRR